jgi:hypothetical protein
MLVRRGRYSGHGDPEFEGLRRADDGLVNEPAAGAGLRAHL